MMDIGNYFSSSKKHDFIDNSKEGTDPNKATSSRSHSDHSIFEEGLDSSICRTILFDCLKNWESKVNKYKQIQIPWKSAKLKMKSNLEILLKQLIFFQKSFTSLKPIGRSKKK